MRNFTEASVAENSVNQSLLGALDAFDNISTTRPSPPQSIKEQRNTTRYMVSWRVAVFVKGRDFYYGRIKDIALCGAAILNELNLKNGTSVTLKIHVPTLDRCCESRALVVHCKTTYAVYDANYLCFRVGVAFDKFELESDRAYLEERLTSHHVALPDYACRRSTDTVALR